MPQYALRHALPLLRAPDALTVRCQKTRSLMMIQLEMPQEVPVGETFSYKGKRTKYVCLPRSCGCEDCAFLFTAQHGKKRRVEAGLLCGSFVCMPTQRTDQNFVKAVKLSKLRQTLPY